MRARMFELTILSIEMKGLVWLEKIILSKGRKLQILYVDPSGSVKAFTILSIAFSQILTRTGSSMFLSVSKCF